MELYIDEETAEVAIKNKTTGEVWMTNPHDRKENAFLSQILIEYKKGNSTAPATQMNTYTNCVGFGDPRVEYAYTENSVVVIYNMASKELFKTLPERITEDEYNRLLAVMETNEAVQAEIAKDQRNNNLDRIIRALYTSKVAATDNTPAYRKLADKVNVTTKAKANLYFQLVGLTEEGILAEYAKIGYEVPENDDIAKFTVPLEYRLTDTGFIAEVDASNISYDRETYTLCNVTVLPYFNAATKNEQGYNFIPDGSGALVRFEDVVSKNSTSSIDIALYGKDNSFYGVSTKIEEQGTMPVFGQYIHEKPYDSGFLAIIESGDAVATVTSKHDTYHSVSAKFTVSPTDVTKISSTGDVTDIGLKTNVEFTEKCTVNYYMLTSEAAQNELGVEGYNTSYVGMAQMYRDILTENGTLEKITDEEANKGAKLFLEVFGSMKVEKRFATIPITVNDSLTTFDQVMLIQEELSNEGVGPMNFILTGFANEGLSAKYPTKIKWLKSVGGKSGFEKLINDAESKGYEVSPNFDFTASTYFSCCSQYTIPVT